jgi:methionine synthase I (cobalamin-dependent)
VLDGALGSELLRRGADPQCLEATNLTNPSLVLELIGDYVKAGANFVGTNSFQANAVALAAGGWARKAGTLNRAAARLSREAAGDGTLVIGSIGPIGVRLRRPRVDPERARDAYAEQAKALEAGGADALVLETLVDLEEAELALEVLAREVSIPFGVSMSFDSSSAGPRTTTGATPEALSALARRNGAAFVGANCGDGFENAETVARALLPSGLPVWVKPSAGLPSVRPFDAFARSRFAALGPRLSELGVAAFGGCCGTDPELVALLSAELATHPIPTAGSS